MNRFCLDFHHLGLAVPEPETAFNLLAPMGYHIGPIVFDPEQLVRLAMCRHPHMPDVEIVTASDVASPIDRLLRRHGPCFYHVCYVTPCISTALAALERDGFNIIVVSEPKPAILFGGREVAFCSVNGFGLIELLQDQSLPSNQ